jgi:hypothetical protein
VRRRRRKKQEEGPEAEVAARPVRYLPCILHMFQIPMLILQRERLTEVDMEVVVYCLTLHAPEFHY